MDLAQHQNTKVLGYLSRGKSDAPAFAPHDAVQDADCRCGCHPDIVERLWDQIGASLPEDCRCLVYGAPALVHSSGVILAIGIGTQYVLHLPGSLATEATKAGAKTSATWSDGGDMDTRRDLGDDWIFGGWLADELLWCKTVYEMFDHAA